MKDLSGREDLRMELGGRMRRGRFGEGKYAGGWCDREGCKGQRETGTDDPPW